MDLWGPHHPVSLLGKKYAAISLDAKTRKTWIHYLRSKNEFINIFQIYLPKIENEYTKSMRVPRANEGGKFMSTKLKNIYEQKVITIKYIACYIYKKNKIAK